jgi:hypothetical protein
MFAMELILFLSNAKTLFPIESIFGVHGFLGLTPANVAYGISINTCIPSKNLIHILAISALEPMPSIYNLYFREYLTQIDGTLHYEDIIFLALTTFGLRQDIHCLVCNPKV